MDSDGSAVGLLDEPALEEATRADGTGAPRQARPDQDIPIGPDAGITAILSTTRAMRRLAPDPVPDELIRAIVEAATWAPSMGNGQMAAFVVVTDRTTMARLAGLWRRLIDDYRLLREAAGMPSGSDPSSERMRAAIEYQADHFAETPALIVVCDDPTALGMTRGRARAIALLVRRVGLRRSLGLSVAVVRAGRAEGASIYPAVQNLLLAARAHGLGACLTSWHLFAEDEFKEIVGIPKHVRTWAVVPVGWPLSSFGPVRRRPVDEAIHREHW